MLNPAALVPLYEAAKAMSLAADLVQASLNTGSEADPKELAMLTDSIDPVSDALALAESPSPVGEVGRWEMVNNAYSSHGESQDCWEMVTDPAGRYVLHTDYAALSAELAEVRGVLERISTMPVDGTSDGVCRALLDHAVSSAALARAATVKGKP